MNNNVDVKKIKQHEDSFSSQVDRVINGTYPKSSMLIVSQNTPQILQDLGLKNLPITMTQRHLDTIMNKRGKHKGANYHNLGIKVVKQLPLAIERPLNVLQSDTVKNSIVIVTELSDKQKRPVIVIIRINGTGTINNIEIDSNILTSAYGRNKYDEFMKRNIKKGNLLYDKQEGIIKRSDGKLQLPPTTSSSNIYSTTIIDDNQE